MEAPPNTLRMKLQGIYSSLTTPFQYDGSLYKAKVLHNVEKWNKTSLAGYVVCGVTGEGALLTAEERIQVLGWVAEAAAPGKLLISGACAESVRETVALIQRAAEIGYKLALIPAPRIAHDHATQLAYFRAVADQSPLPIVVSNCLEASHLSQHPNVVAIHGSEHIERAKGVPVLADSAATLWPSLRAGAVGAVLDFANAAPYACITIWEAFRTREQEAAEDWQQRISKAAGVLTTYGVPGLKYAMERNGYYGGPPRLPLVHIGPAAQQEIDAAFEGIKG